MTAQQPPIGELTFRQYCKQMDVSGRSAERAGVVLRSGIPELIRAVETDRMSVYRGEQIARLPADQQPDAIEQELQSKSRKRPAWELQQDEDRLVAVINRMARRWTDSDRLTMALVLHEFARQLADGNQQSADDLDDGEGDA